MCELTPALRFSVARPEYSHDEDHAKWCSRLVVLPRSAQRLAGGKRTRRGRRRAALGGLPSAHADAPSRTSGNRARRDSNPRRAVGGLRAYEVSRLFRTQHAERIASGVVDVNDFLREFWPPSAPTVLRRILRSSTAKRMLAEGKSQVEVARILKVSRTTIQRSRAA
jgi:hypothetical protein